MGLRNFIKTKGAILEYGEYYSSYRNELIKILKFYKDMGHKISIWGAGLKGIAFLNCIDKKGEYIHSVIDMNKQLQGSGITRYHTVCSIESALELCPKVIIIMNAAHFADNHALLKEKEYTGIILDLDNIIENKVEPEVIWEEKCTNSTLGYEVDLAKMHRQVLDILKEIDRICKKHGITYFLSAGSALGAARHKGFIPWDDDADVGMLRNDFEHFRQVVEQEMDASFYYEKMKKGSDFYRAFDKIGKRQSSFVLYHLKNLKVHHGIHVDIFPFDNVPADEKQREIQRDTVQIYRKRLLQKLVPHVVNSRNPLRRLIINHEYYLMKFYPYKQLYRRINDALKKHEKTETGYVADLLTHYKKIMYFKKNDIIPVRYVDFEDYQFPVPNNLNEYLRVMYGDYMMPPPEDKRFQRHRIVELSFEHAYYLDEKNKKKLK